MAEILEEVVLTAEILEILKEVNWWLKEYCLNEVVRISCRIGVEPLPDTELKGRWNLD
jgi:hypothetical protein